MAIVLVRHGETEWSKARRHTGRTDLPLLPEGRERAATLVDRLQDHRFDEVWCSPLQRARETAELAGLGDARLRLDDRLLEWDYGAYEGRTSKDVLAERPGWWLWTDGCPDGEQPEDVAARCDAVVADLAERLADGTTVAVVAHSHLLRALAARWCEQPIALGGHLKLDTTGVCVLDVERERRAIARWNLG